MPLDPATASRLTKLLGMTGSAFDGEALAAVRKANDLLRNAGLTWSDVIVAPVAKAAWREPADWRDAVAICLGLPDAPLTEWDRSFLFGVAGREVLTERQACQLGRIITACRLHATVAA